jgi:hypothetical protein
MANRSASMVAKAPFCRRRYDSLRRLAQAQQTRAEIAGAARRLFVGRGWAATTVRNVAREAGRAESELAALYDASRRRADQT